MAFLFRNNPPVLLTPEKTKELLGDKRFAQYLNFFYGITAEEALLQAIEDQNVCPGCERHIKDDWVVCPACQTKLRKPCHSCGRLMELPWNLCPYCGTPTPGMRKEGGTMDEVVRSLPADEE